MTETISGSSSKTQKATCSECKRTVYVVALPDGTRVLVDPEIMAVVPLDGGARKITARRSHKERCLQFQLEDERKLAKARLLGRGRRR